MNIRKSVHQLLHIHQTLYLIFQIGQNFLLNQQLFIQDASCIKIHPTAHDVKRTTSTET